jgi:hypothetical protein
VTSPSGGPQRNLLPQSLRNRTDGRNTNPPSVPLVDGLVERTMVFGYLRVEWKVTRIDRFQGQLLGR